MKVEKSPVRSRESAGGFNVIVPLALIAVSIACTSSRSASSHSQLTANQPQPVNSQPIGTPAIGQSSSTATERTACTLSLAEAPIVARIKLGMKAEDVMALFPGSKDDAEVSTAASKRGPAGNATFAIVPSKYGSEDAKQVSRISLSLLDGKISSFNVAYKGPEWPHVDKFVEQFVQDKTLPAVDQWEPYVGLDTQMKVLKCTGFSIRVFSGGEGGNQNYVLVEDVEATKTLKERRQKAREQASPTPAP